MPENILKSNDWQNQLLYTLRDFPIFGFTLISNTMWTVCDIVEPRERSLAFVLQRPEAPGSPPTPFFEKTEPVCLGEHTGLLQSVHGPIMCRQTKAEAASKSLMQNLCSCGCYSGWKNQYCGSDARRWLSALWLTVKAKRDWEAKFTVLEMEWSRVGLIV